MTPYSLYLHIPFCKHRCAYCDFNTYAGQEDSIPAYVDALVREIEYVGSRLPSPSGRGDGGEGEAHTVFFGGGTPSLLSGPQFASIMDALRSAFAFSADAEVSIEANPGTISPDKLAAIRAAGINRISFGVQSANTEELRMLERIHDFFTVIEAVSTARQAGFDNLNLDLIYGLPEQTLQTWQNTVQRVVDLQPEHISAYALTLEHGTPFGRWAAKGLLPLPDPDLAAEMYEWADDFFEANGYVQYEISNWARSVERSFACRHNLQYWRGLPYLAFGAGAHGYANGYRYSNVLRIKTYIERLLQPSTFDLQPFPLTPATVNHHRQTESDDMGEFMMTGLRLTREGVTNADFRSRFGRGLFDVYEKEAGDLIRKGLLEWTGERLRLTRRGRLLGNQVFMQFIDG
ncbi:MAG: radical SAM family heme chaperone HemW [Chloroflexi bacterium]|nr:radical SAM family heme chaperone HemW [Chloroflexota bacterium]